MAQILVPVPSCSHSCARLSSHSPLFFFNDTATTEIYTLSLHDALPISPARSAWPCCSVPRRPARRTRSRRARSLRSEEHTSELQSHLNLVCRLLLEKKKKEADGIARHERGVGYDRVPQDEWHARALPIR